MAKNTSTTAATGKQMAMAPREEDLQKLESLLHDLQAAVDKARDEGQLFMMAQYVRLVALISPEIDRVQRRFKRETLASMRREHSDMKAIAKADALKAQEAQEEADAAAVRARATQGA